MMANELEVAKSLVITMRYLISLENSIKDKGNRIGVVLWTAAVDECDHSRRRENTRTAYRYELFPYSIFYLIQIQINLEI